MHYRIRLPQVSQQVRRQITKRHIVSQISLSTGQIDNLVVVGVDQSFERITDWLGDVVNVGRACIEESSDRHSHQVLDRRDACPAQAIRVPNLLLPCYSQLRSARLLRERTLSQGELKWKRRSWSSKPVELFPRVHFVKVSAPVAPLWREMSGIQQRCPGSLSVCDIEPGTLRCGTHTPRARRGRRHRNSSCL